MPNTFKITAQRLKTSRTMNDKYTLLTGATGQIGRFLLRDLLLAQPDRIAVLVRGRNGMSAHERVEQVLAEWYDATGEELPTPVCLEGDVTQEGFGLSQNDRLWLGSHCDTMMHNAASVDFTGGGTGQTWKNNTSGAQYALDVCREIRIDHLAYTSTAYVCGKRLDTIYEDELEMGQEFRNEYEHSKYEAERIIRGPSYPDAVTIIRPAIVLGDYDTGRTQSYHGFYQAVKFTDSFANYAMKDETGHWTHDVRFMLTGDEINNFITVDWVGSVMAAILDQPKAFGRTFHLTPEAPTTCLEMQQAFEESFNFSGVRFVGPDSDLMETGSPEELRFYEYMQEFSAYWGNDPRFDRSETDSVTAEVFERRIDVPCLVRLMNHAVATRFGKKSRQLVKA